MTKSKIKISYFILLVLLCHTISYGQDFSKTWTSQYGVKFIRPSGFDMYNNDEEPFLQYFFYMDKPDDRERNILPDFYLVNKDSSILILVDAYNCQPMEPDIVNRYWVDPNRPSFNSVAYYADTTKESIKYYPAASRKYSRADWIAEFTRDLGSNNTLGDFKYNRCLVFNKHDQIFLQVTYLFKESAKAKMHNVLHSTKRMFRFVDLPQIPPVGVKTNLDRHYVKVDSEILADSLATKWNQGKIYQDRYYFWGEDGAFKQDGMVITVTSPTYEQWPYMNHIYQARMDTTSNRSRWDAANKDHHRFLALARSTPYRCTVSETGRLHADEAYI